MSPRPRVRPGALLAILMVLALALSGCHGLPHEPKSPAPAGKTSAGPAGQDEPRAAAQDDFKPNSRGANLLPVPVLHAEIKQATGIVSVTLEGATDQIATFRLSFGDGSPVVESAGVPAARYTHEFPSPATFREYAREFTVSLTLYSLRGHTQTGTTQVTIDSPDNLPPVATLTITDGAGPAPLRPTMSLFAYDPDGTIVSWRIDFGDGTQPLLGALAPDETLVHEFRIIGTHTVTLTAIDERGLEGTTTSTVHVWTPQDHLVWTIDKDAQSVTIGNGNGTRMDTWSVRTPTCGRGTTCETPVDIASANNRAYLLLDRAQADGALKVYDAHTGLARGTHIIPHAPEALHVDPKGGAWVTYRTSGTITHLSATNQLTHYETTLPADTQKLAAFSGDGLHAWFIGSGQPALAVHFDLATKQADPLTLPLAFQPVALAHQNTYNQAIVVGQDGRIVYLDSFGVAPAVLSILDLGLTPGATARDITCHGRHTCWVTTSSSSLAPAMLVGIPARADLGTSIETNLIRSELPAGVEPTHITATDTAVVIAVGGASGAGIILADPSNGAFLLEAIDPDGETGARHSAPSPSHPHLIYLEAPEHPGWQIVDTASARIVHLATLESHVDGIALGRLPRSMNSR